jgi:hypothetical protein
LIAEGGVIPHSEGGYLGLAIQANGKVVAVGYQYEGPDGNPSEIIIDRFLSAASGLSPDTSFNGNGQQTLSIFPDQEQERGLGNVGWSVALQTDGKILVAATATTDSSHSVSEYTITRLIGDPVGSVSGTVYDDSNGDGVRESGEPGLAGQMVYADLNNNGIQDAGDPSTTTDASGAYQLSGLPQGPVIIREVLKPGERQSYPFNLGEHQVVGETPVTGADFGVTTKVYVSGKVTVNGKGVGNLRVYADLNHDGRFETNENSKLTNSDGTFAFVALSAGTYTFRVVLPAGQVQTTPANGAGITVSLSSGKVVQNLAFALVSTPAPILTAAASAVLDQNDTIAGIFDESLSIPLQWT